MIEMQCVMGLHVDDGIFFGRYRKGQVVLEFDVDGRILACEDAGELSFISGSEGKDLQLVYLFSLDDRQYFLSLDTTGTDKDGYTYHDLRDIRNTSVQKDVFIVFTAYHLWRWYTDNRFCGRCADRLIFHEKERALRARKLCAPARRIHRSRL